MTYKDVVSPKIARDESTKFEFYIQTTPYTCIAAGALMMFHHFDKLVPLSKNEEMRIHRIIRFWKGIYGDFGCYSKLAVYAMENGYNASLFLQFKGKPDPNFINSNLYDRYLKNYLPFIEVAKKNKKFCLREGDFTVKDLCDEIDKGRLVLVEINYPTSYPSHNVVIYGKEADNLIIADPIKGAYIVKLTEMDKLIHLDYMMNALSIGRFDISNQLRVDRSSELTLELSGIPSSPYKNQAKVVKIEVGVNEEESIKAAMAESKDGFILVADRVDPSMTALLIRCGGVVTEIGGIASHAAIICREIGIACVTSVKHVTKLFNYGDEISVDGVIGTVKLIKRNNK